MNIESLRKLAGRAEIDYPFLLSALQDYSRPRDKISEWLKSGDLIRVKKGLYVFGKGEILYSPEVLANLIYGPSAISLNYALAFYGLIPERVATVTSITNKRYKEFSTPIGNFVYYYLPNTKYSIGIHLETLSVNKQFLIASPEKALCDQIYIVDKELDWQNLNEIEAYLFHDLRIDENVLKNFDRKKIMQISKVYKDDRLELLSKFLQKWKS